MIGVGEASRKYGVTYSLLLNWIQSGYIATEELYPGTGRRDVGITWREEEVLHAMVLLHKAGVKTATATLLARGGSAQIRALQEAIDKCKHIRATHPSVAPGG